MAPFVEKRANPEEARAILERLYQEPYRATCLRQLAESIHVAHDVSPSSWGVTLHDSEIRLNVGSLEAVVLRKDELGLTIDQTSASEAAWMDIETSPWLRFKPDHQPFPSMQSAFGIIVPAAKLVDSLPMLQPLHLAHVKRAAHAVRTHTNFHLTHSPGVLEYLRATIAKDLPDPSYVTIDIPQVATAQRESLSPIDGEMHRGSFSALVLSIDNLGLRFSPEVISNYLLALQTKRFVIFSGISGTGKTQLALVVAQHFRQKAKMPQTSQLPHDALITVRDYMLKYGHMVLPASLTAKLIRPPSGRFADSRQIRVQFPRGEQTLTMSKDAERNVTNLFFKGNFKTWFREHLSAGSKFAIELMSVSDGESDMLRFHVPSLVDQIEPLTNLVVVPVKPDWTDNRGLLGYFNPLIKSYAQTPLLLLLLDARDEVARAEQDGREPSPYFVILDEMNLARVEHYFSDFLSALESGEPIHLHDHLDIEDGETEDAMAIPRQLHIPENVFFTGTVNVDETTYMFSPKVLDRAFTIELNEVDLVTLGAKPSMLARSFSLTRSGGSLDAKRKPSTEDWIAFGSLCEGSLKQCVIDLQALLQEEDRPFGYRVAVEIARFVVLANEQTDGSEDSLWAALDLALLEKILPKFHGTQQELEPVLSRIEEFVAVRSLPRMAKKIATMLRRLQRQGFTSFIE